MARRRSAARALKKVHAATIAAAVICLIIGIAVGVVYALQSSKNDCFELIGNLSYSADVGSEFVYAEEGISAVSFGRDVSDRVQVETTLKKDSAGNYIIPTEQEGVYTITYTVDCFKFGENAPNGVIKRIRTFTVCDNEEDGRNGED